ncbi:aminotransferase class I/II-fold pyridoxal phosphate-dependent enzyme [Flavobacterium undicola]|uniref:aminotransferase class I/II-fold pyridoxal phosphate-dependent enzyme n=1 Tax=Flavobacterium undicola TaxID=1932779 RepID=UPI0013784B78|nr:aminotransferase class I/II-fold pyridoxal phosphate-dependent enzyme [Flavobacterium undicola]MBA0883228.1 pyridoxal phosphate-dependent aminotransferase family protein [Flavobacterium undicola]
MKVTKFPDRVLKIDGGNYLYFGGTAYLGLPPNKKFQKILFKNITRWGTAYGSSRNANIKLTAYEKGETFLAKFIQAEAALTVSSGMLAGKLVLETLKSETAVFYHFPDNHVAISNGDSIPFFINEELNPRLLNNKPEKITILTDAVATNTVTAVSLSVLEQIPNHKEITLVIDESHSLGILGTDGNGVFSTINQPNIKRKIMVSSLGKAMGLSGGVIAGDIDFINKIKANDTFVSSAGMNPAFVKTLADAEKIYWKQNKKLRKNLAYIHSKLIPNTNILFDKNYPVIYPRIENINTILASNKIIITNFKYTSETDYLNRIIITANHKKKDLDKIIEILNRCD